LEIVPLMETNKNDYVLVVEDNEDLRKLMSLYLQCEDFHVITAGDGYEAMKKVEEYKPKVVLTKGYFNNEDQFGLIKTIRQTWPKSDLPVIALLDSRNGHVAAKEAGATEIVRVPDSYSSLKGIIDKYIKK